jgi:hypothetical protein
MIYESKSQLFPRRVNVMIEGDNFDSCTESVIEFQERFPSATFTMPTQTYSGSWLANGHYNQKVTS